MPAPAQIRVQAQIGGGAIDPGKPEPPPAYPSDQAVIRSLDDAKKRISEKSFAAASAALQQIFNHPEETWVQEPDKTWRSARVLAERLLLADEALLVDYRGQFEAEAAADLMEAGDDPQKLAAVMRRFFLTRSGAEATERLATILLDAGRANLAAVYAERLLECPAHKPLHSAALKAKDAIARKMIGDPLDSKGLDGDLIVRFGGKPWKLAELVAQVEPSPAPAAETLADWPIPTGNATRTAQSSGGLPLLGAEQTALARPITENKKLTTQFERVAERNRHHSRATIYGAQPIIVGSAAYARTFRGVEAVDLRIGMPLWPKPYEDGEPIDKQELAFDEWEDAGRAFNSSAVDSFVLGNTLYGTLTSDGARIYLVDELYVQPASYNLFVMGRDKSDATRRTCNRLTALDAATGKVRWRLGGSEARKAGDPNGQLYFFGPPTPINGKLYVIAELQSEVGLWELDPETGRPTWKQRLMLMHRRVDADPFRRSQACLVVASEGIALCPTNTARLFGVDLVSHSVLWERNFDGDLAQRSYLNFNFIEMVPPPDNPNVADPPAVVGSRVVFQGANLQGVHCLDLRSGRTRWRKERGGDQHVAGVQQGKVILVGAGRARALDLNTGDETWMAPTPTPSGRGVFANGKYLLPTERGDCLALDLATGKPAGTSVSIESPNRPLGNLAARGDALVSLGCGGLRVFPLVELIRREAGELLAKNANDPRGLYEAGLIALHEQKLNDAASKLLASLRSPADFSERPQASRTLLRLASEEGLSGYAAMGELLGELRKAAKEPRDLAVVLRLEARAHLNAGHWAEALLAAEQQAGLREGALVQSLADSSMRDPWLWARAFARRVFAASPAEKHDELLRVVERRHAAAEGGDVEELHHIAFMYDQFPVGRKARLALARRQLARRRLDLASLAFSAALRSATSDDEKAAAFAGLSAVADVGRLPFDAYWYLERWKYEAFEGRDSDGRTVTQALAEYLKANGATPPALGEPKHWSLAAVRAEVTAAGDRHNSFGRQWIRATGSDAPYFQRHAFSFKKGESAFVTMDLASGRMDRETTLGEENFRALGSAVADSAPVLGYVGFTAIDDRVAAISILDRSSAVWCLAPGASDSNRDELDVPVEWSQFIDDRRNHEPTVKIGPVGPDFIIARTMKELFALDPATGRVLWRRSDVGAGRQLFGDADHLYFVGPRGDFLLLRPADGEKLAEGVWKWFGENYADEQCRGRLILRTTPHADVRGKRDGLDVHLWDPAADKDIWSRRFPEDAQVNARSATAPIVATDRAGRVEILDETTGRTLARFEIDKPRGERVPAIRAFRHGDVILAIVPEGARGERRVLFGGSISGVENYSVHGRLVALAVGGTKPLWQKNVRESRVLGWPLDSLPVVIALETPEGRRSSENAGATLRVFERATGRPLTEASLPSDLRMISDVEIVGRRSHVDFTGGNRKAQLWFDDPTKAAKKGDSPEASLDDVLGVLGKILDTNSPPPPKKK